MFRDHSSPDDLFDRASRGMLRRLEGVRDPTGVFAALRWGMDELERTFASSAAKARGAAACRAGCSFCCSVPLGVQAHEVLLAAEYIQTHFPAVEIAGVIGHAAARRSRVEGLGASGNARVLQPCALLREGRCSIYAARPEICRAHHSSDASVCEAYNLDPAVDVEKVYVPALRRRLFAVMLGLDQAMEEAGFDARAYDFGSALHEALTNSECAMRWMRKERAFPESCEEPALPG